MENCPNCKQEKPYESREGHCEVCGKLLPTTPPPTDSRSDRKKYYSFITTKGFDEDDIEAK